MHKYISRTAVKPFSFNDNDYFNGDDDDGDAEVDTVGEERWKRLTQNKREAAVAVAGRLETTGQGCGEGSTIRFLLNH